MKNIVLIGFMGTGKSRVGHMVARKLGMKFIDTDDLISQRLQMPVSDIFARLGEGKFREIEQQTIADVSLKSRHVIATGGGVPILKDNVDNLKTNGILFCLSASPEIIYRRTLRADTRPLLKSENKLEHIKSLMESRHLYYSVADYHIDTSSRPASAVAREIVELYQSDGNNQG
ncbi:MAG: shikimate kinase [Armatimonadota bacterium]